MPERISSWSSQRVIVVSILGEFVGAPYCKIAQEHRSGGQGVERTSPTQFLCCNPILDPSKSLVLLGTHNTRHVSNTTTANRSTSQNHEATTQSSHDSSYPLELS